MSATSRSKSASSPFSLFKRIPCGGFVVSALISRISVRARPPILIRCEFVEFEQERKRNRNLTQLSQI